MNTDISQIKLPELCRHLDDISRSALKELTKFQTSRFEIPTFLLLNIYERAITSIISIRALLQEEHNIRYHENSIGIILRSNLNDLLIGLYLKDAIRKSNSELDSLNEAIKPIVTDHLINTFRYLKTLRDSQRINQEKYREYVDTMWKQYSPLFSTQDPDYTNPNSKLIKSSHLSPKGLVDKIDHVDDKKLAERAFDLYQIYSKYDHVGIMTNSIQGNFDSAKLNLLKALELVVYGIAQYAILLVGEDSVEVDPSLVSSKCIEFKSYVDRNLSKSG